MSGVRNDFSVGSLQLSVLTLADHVGSCVVSDKCLVGEAESGGDQRDQCSLLYHVHTAGLMMNVMFRD